MCECLEDMDIKKLEGGIYMNIMEKFRFPSPNPQVNMYIITYMSGSYKVKGLLAEPKDDLVYDGFLYLRGGIKSVGMVRPARIGQFASEGFVVFAPFYRGNRGGEGDEDFAGEDRMDAYSAFDLLKQYPRVAKNRIHVFGFSRGGVMALHTAIHRKEAKIRCNMGRGLRYGINLWREKGFTENDETGNWRHSCKISGSIQRANPAVFSGENRITCINYTWGT